MIGFTTRRTRGTASLAAALLVVQALAGGLVPLAHAAERLSAPAHIEAQHDAGCLAVHDELRCALCHYAAARFHAPQPRTVAPVAERTACSVVAHAVAPAPPFAHLTAPPRAPPGSQP